MEYLKQRKSTNRRLTFKPMLVSEACFGIYDATVLTIYRHQPMLLAFVKMKKSNT